MSVVAVLGALIVGGTLGLLGSGGSILTVPILVYLLGHPMESAVPESLAIVGAIALFSAVRHAAGGRVRWDAFLAFAVGGVVGTLGGSALGKRVPDEIQLLTFAVVMGLAAWRMLMPRPRGQDNDTRPHPALLGVVGLGVGVLTGFVGVGGGFVIVPALVLIARVPMQQAVATSLALIVVNAGSGLVGYWPLDGVDWAMVSVFVGLGIVGSLVGSTAGKKLPQATLKRVFAVSLIPMAGWILFRELMKLMG